MLRWAHFWLFMLAILEEWLQMPSPTPPKSSVEYNDSKQQEMDKMKVHHRDGGFKLFSRVCATVSVFVYQGAVFFA